MTNDLLVGGSQGFANNTTAHAIAQELRFRIFSKQLAPGQRLLQTEVASQFGVSITPVREAFAILKAEGIVRALPYRGVEVANPSIEELTELSDLRGWLEEKAVPLAVPSLRDETIDAMAEALGRMKSSLDVNARLEPHRVFHDLLYRDLGRPRLAELIGSLRDASAPYLGATLAGGRALTAEDAGHEALLDACRRRDAEGAMVIMLQHLQSSRDAAARFIGRAGSNGVLETDAEQRAP